MVGGLFYLWPWIDVDTRLFLLNGQRLSRLRKNDVPVLVRGIIAVLRKRAHFGMGYFYGVGYVKFWDGASSFLVTQEDWARVFPLVKDGSLDPLLSPVGQPVAYLDPLVSFKESVLDHADSLLFAHMVGLLEPLFPVEWPTSNI